MAFDSRPASRHGTPSTSRSRAGGIDRILTFDLAFDALDEIRRYAG